MMHKTTYGYTSIGKKFTLRYQNNLLKSPFPPFFIFYFFFNLLLNIICSEVGEYLHSCEGDLVCKSVNEKVPYFNAPIYFENKALVGKVDEIFGQVSNHVSLKFQALDDCLLLLLLLFLYFCSFSNSLLVYPTALHFLISHRHFTFMVS